MKNFLHTLSKPYYSAIETSGWMGAVAFVAAVGGWERWLAPLIMVGAVLLSGAVRRLTRPGS